MIIEKDLISIFEKNRITKIAAKGKKFDPNLHQAMAEIEDNNSEVGTIVQEIQPGYMLGERLLRPVLVIKEMGSKYSNELIEGNYSYSNDWNHLINGEHMYKKYNNKLSIYDENYYKDELIEVPVEELGVDRGFWVFRQPDYTKEYIVVADVARGDGTDFSACQVFEVEDMEQVAEYKGQLSTTDYGNFLIEVATKYNDALLVVENNNIGWATIQTIIDRGYKNLFYQSKDLQVVDVEHQVNNKYRAQDRNMVPGFSTTQKTRPLVIAKMEEYTREKLVKIHSNRLIDELFVFIYKSGVSQSKAEAMQGYNDDLVMSYSIALWVRDTALRLQKDKNDQQWATMNSMLKSNGNQSEHAAGFGVGSVGNQKNPYEMDIGTGEKEDLTWLIK